MKYTKEQINEKFQKLASPVQDIILSTNTEEAIKTIADKNSLHIDTAGQLNEQITFVMIGLEPASEFIKHIKERLQLPEEKARAVAKDVNEQIFNKIREVLKNTPQQPSHEISTDADKSALERKKEQLEKEVEQKTNLEAGHPSGTGAPPPNLPTQSSVATGQANDDANLGAANLGARPLSGGESGGGGMPKDIVKEKLEGQVRMQKEEIEIRNNNDSGQPEKKRPYSIDPYREPIE
jgi:hypothetical protein